MNDINDPIPVSSALAEETARAEVYGLLAALYYAPPSADLMAQLRVAVVKELFKISPYFLVIYILP